MPWAPEAVCPPGRRDFEASAIAWPMDLVPPEFWQYGVLRRHPAALAGYYTHGCVEGAREGVAPHARS